MGLLDGLLGGVLDGLGRDHRAGGVPLVAQLALQVLRENGGLQQVLQRLEQQGLGEQARSWVRTGPNLPVSGSELTRALGSADVARVAAQLGLPQGSVADTFAQVLPHVVDGLTPHGRITSESDDVVTRTLAELERKRAT